MLVGIVCSLAINVSGNWLLVPRYGYRASAYLTIASALAYLLTLSILTPLEELRESAAANQQSCRGECRVIRLSQL